MTHQIKNLFPNNALKKGMKYCCVSSYYSSKITNLFQFHFQDHEKAVIKNETSRFFRLVLNSNNLVRNYARILLQ